MKKILALALALSMVLALAACGNSGGSKPPAQSGAPAGGDIKGKVVAFIPKLTGNSFFEAANDGAQEYAAKWGITVKYMGSATASVTDQLTVIDQAIAEGVDAISISSVDATALDEKLKEAQNAGIVVTTWDSDVSSSARSLMVSQGTADVLGPMLVEMGVKSLAERGKDPAKDAIKYVWHYSQATVADQNSWYVAGKKYIDEKYPNWVAVSDPQYSEQDSQKSVSVGEAILEAYPDIDLIICNDSTALPGQCQAAQNKGKTANDVTITGFCTPSGTKSYLDAGILTRWGLWDCGIQGALGCYFAAYLAAGNTVKAGDTINVPDIGECKIIKNEELVPGDTTPATNSGVVLLPERVEFTKENIGNYNF